MLGAQSTPQLVQTPTLPSSAEVGNPSSDVHPQPVNATPCVGSANFRKKKPPHCPGREATGCCETAQWRNR